MKRKRECGVWLWKGAGDSKPKKKKGRNENQNSENENNRNSSNAQRKRCWIAGFEGVGRDLVGVKEVKERKCKHVFVRRGIKTIFKTTFIHL